MEKEKIEYNAVLFFVASYIKDNSKYSKDLYYKAAEMLHLHFGAKFLKHYYDLKSDCSDQQLHDMVVSDLAKQISVGLWEIR